jgi:uncharacterized tellurite resistance protein B-like protein
MFESLTHWFESLKEESKLFDHADDEILHSALASVLYHVISADQHVDAKEKHEFDRILKQEFDLNDEQVDHLYRAAKGSTADVHGDLHTLNFYLKHNPAVRLTFMRKMLQLVDVHGARKEKLDLFYETLHEVFPEVREIGNEDEL